MSDNVEPIVLQTGEQVSHSVIWLHGLGADGHDFVPIVEELALPVPVRFVFPHAPMQPVSINNGFVMRAWYDITQAALSKGVDAENESSQDELGIRASQVIIEALIAKEVACGIPPGNIYLAGFSQGGAVALHTGLRQVHKLGGVIALSTYLPLMGRVATELQAQAQATPFFMGHGYSDPVVPYDAGIAARDALLNLNCKVEWRAYDMQHSVCQEELADISAWLRSTMR